MLWNKSQNKWQLGYLGCVIDEHSVMACMIRPFRYAFTRNQQYFDMDVIEKNEKSEDNET